MAETVRQIILPALDDDPHTRQVAIHLVGLATYAGRRGPDPIAVRVDEIADLLDAAARWDPLVTGRWTAGTADTCRRAGRRRGRAVRRWQTDATDDDEDGVRDELRVVLVRQLDADLATEDVLLGALRRLPDG